MVLHAAAESEFVEFHSADEFRFLIMLPFLPYTKPSLNCFQADDDEMCTIFSANRFY